MKYRVHFHTGASASITVEVPDDFDGDEYDAREHAIEIAYADLPTLCAHCSGWGQKAGIELGEWEVDEGDDAVSEVES